MNFDCACRFCSAVTVGEAEAAAGITFTRGAAATPAAAEVANGISCTSQELLLKQACFDFVSLSHTKSERLHRAEPLATA